MKDDSNKEAVVAALAAASSTPLPTLFKIMSIIFVQVFVTLTYMVLALAAAVVYLIAR